jgi:Flavin containing amine oxidoreductase
MSILRWWRVRAGVEFARTAMPNDDPGVSQCCSRSYRARLPRAMRLPLVVAGGGISGLIASRTLAYGAPTGTPIVLLEAADRLGGKIRTQRYEGAAIEAGPDCFPTRGGHALSVPRARDRE